MTEAADTSACRRCGTCCRKGGPALHRADRGIIETGAIQLKQLFTIRQGEPAWDNVAGGVLPAPGDIIKVKSLPGRRTCAFYGERAAACKIYARRPVECRALDCNDTREIEAIYRKDRLTRKDLLQSVPGLWELVEDHQQRCSWERVLPLAAEVRRSGQRETVEELLYLVRYDLHLRDLVVENGGTDADLLDFLFGTPLISVLKGLGVRIRQSAGRLVVARDGE
jgi:Fe-S-cluster containining protein